MRVYRWIGCLLLLGGVLFSHLPAVQADGGTMWRLDAPASAELPRNFRMSSDAAKLQDMGRWMNLSGMDWLRISGSGQPAEAGLGALYERLREETMVPIYLVDLRQESHGFFGGAAVSWYGKNNWSNRGMGAAAVEADEQERLSFARNQMVEALPLGNEDKAAFAAQKGIVKHAVTEREAAEKLGFHYVRIAATDQMWPEPQAVDAFIRFYQSLPEGPVWVHFHCQAGHGRTTIFMAMYDILRNPNLPLEDIAAREQGIGGTDVLAQADEGSGSWRAKLTNEKAAKMQLFYQYVQEQEAANFAVSWSSWLQSH